MKLTALQSIKFSRLKRRLSLSHWQVVGVLESLWLFTQTNAPAGDIGRLSDEDIAAGIEWPHDPAKLVTDLIESGWLDRCEVNRVTVHDWEDHCPNFIKGNFAKHGKTFAKTVAKQAASDGARQAANTSEQGATIPNQSLPCLALPCQSKNLVNEALTDEKPKRKKNEYVDEKFNRFWNAYPRGEKKHKTYTEFVKLKFTDDEFIEVLAALDRQKKTADWTKESGQFIPHPDVWIRNRRWEDDLKTSSANGHTAPSYPSAPAEDKPATLAEINAQRARQGLPPIPESGAA